MRIAVLGTALLMVGTGTVFATQYAVGHSRGGGDRGGAQTGTIVCPEVGEELEEVPRPVRRRVGWQLSRLDSQVAIAYWALRSGRFRTEDVLNWLESKRSRTIRRISNSIAATGTRPEGLEALAACAFEPVEEEPVDPVDPGEGGDGGAGGDGGGQGEGGGEGEGGNGPAEEDFVDITTVQPNVVAPQPDENASTGTFGVDCGLNEGNHFNSDNVIVAPGVENGARHLHDHVGNVSTNGFSTDESLAAADTTCVNGDQSTHYWPVLRSLDGRDAFDAELPGGGPDGNAGTILRPESVSISFRGSPVGEVVDMPRFLRIITGDARAFTNGTANANPGWSCTGFEDRVILTDKYPLCPDGSNVLRIFDFQSCWDGQNTDSANHRDHVAFAREDGSCPDGFVAIPQLVHVFEYDVPDGIPYAVDGFAEQLHKPVTDHSDFINVMTEDLMREVVDCINTGQQCVAEPR
ncbi:DUF1996 domain-containing protein [Streptomyces aidingensis]|nr:DUF1996 domain-containing protein [Streptomyces aidingensis]